MSFLPLQASPSVSTRRVWDSKSSERGLALVCKHIGSSPSRFLLSSWLKQVTWLSPESGWKWSTLWHRCRGRRINETQLLCMAIISNFSDSSQFTVTEYASPLMCQAHFWRILNISGILFFSLLFLYFNKTLYNEGITCWGRGRGKLICDTDAIFVLNDLQFVWMVSLLEYKCMWILHKYENTRHF